MHANGELVCACQPEFAGLGAGTDPCEYGCVPGRVLQITGGCFFASAEKANAGNRADRAR